MPTTLRLFLLLTLGLLGLQPVGYAYDAPDGFASGAQNIVVASPEAGAVTAESTAPVPLNFNREGAASGTPANIRTFSNFVAAETTAARTNFNVYEVLSEQPINGVTRATQRAAANDALYTQLQANPALAQTFNDQLGTDVLAHMDSGSGSSLLNPPGTAWHHPFDNPDVLQLLRTSEHTNPLLQPVLHPGGVGGFGNFYAP